MVVSFRMEEGVGGVSEYTDDFTGYIPVFMAVAFHWRKVWADYVKAHGMISQPCSCVYEGQRSL